MKTVTLTIADDALAVLSGCYIEERHFEGTAVDTIVRIRDGQLERKLYLRVNSVLVDLGGKWSRHTGGHLFPQSVEEVRAKLDECIRTGEIAPPRKNGFFRTPKAVVERMLDFAQLTPGNRILEPSCGDGALLKHLEELEPAFDTFSILAIEIDEQRASQALKALPGAVICQSDFMGDTWVYEKGDTEFDRILANPPFENRQDAQHILRAYMLLRPGGILVSVAASSGKFRRETEYVQIRELVNSGHGNIIDLPAGSFIESGTAVNAVLVVLERPS